MPVQSLTPIVTTPHLAAARDFYVRHFGFHVTYDSDHYVGLCIGGEDSAELGFVAPDAMTPDVFDGRGAALILRVADADATHRALVAAGAPIVSPPTDQPWGARQFVTRDPAGVALFVSHPIPMSPELAAHVR